MVSEGQYSHQVIWSDSLLIVKVATLTTAGLKMRSVMGPPQQLPSSALAERCRATSRWFYANK